MGAPRFCRLAPTALLARLVVPLLLASGALGSCAVPGSTVSYSRTQGCSLPRWKQGWGMHESTYGYCYHNCPLDALSAHRDAHGLWAGVVGVDHYWTHQGMPCKGGEPDEFAAQDAYAAATKARFPGARVLEYRITDAVPYAPIVHQKMLSDPSFFVRFDNGSICLEPAEHQTGRPGDNCSWPIRAAAYDWSQAAVRTWYLENIIHPTLKVGDGAWIDGDGPDNGAYECSGTHKFHSLRHPYPALNTTKAIASFCAGEDLVLKAAQEYLIANGGYEYECIQFDAGLPHNYAEHSAPQCIELLRNISQLR